MPRLHISSVLLVGTVCLSIFLASALAQDITRQELLNFDRFLDSHPAIAKELQNNPSLANDSAYVSNHPELKEFLASHPGVREELRENPRRFINRDRGFEKSGKDITRTQVKNFDEFLDNHPAIDKDLEKNPALVNNADYVARHPELRQFLTNHPGIRDELRENPRAVMHREKKFDKKEIKLDKHQQKEAQRERREREREERRIERQEAKLAHRGAKQFK